MKTQIKIAVKCCGFQQASPNALAVPPNWQQIKPRQKLRSYHRMVDCSITTADTCITKLFRTGSGPPLHPAAICQPTEAGWLSASALRSEEHTSELQSLRH